MRYQHVQWTFKTPFYVHCKKHYCIDCGELLRTIKVSRIVNSNSPEAKNYDFSMGDTYMIGNVKFIWTEFQCPKCLRQFTIDEMKRIEKVGQIEKESSKRIFKSEWFRSIWRHRAGAAKMVVNDKVVAFVFSLDIMQSDFLPRLCNECGLEDIYVDIFTVEKSPTSISEQLQHRNFNFVYLSYKKSFQDVAIKTVTSRLPSLLAIVSEYKFEDFTVWSSNERWEQHLFNISARSQIKVEDEKDLYLCYNQAENKVELYLHPKHDAEKIYKLIQESL